MPHKAIILSIQSLNNYKIDHNCEKMIYLQMVCGSQTFDLAELKKVTYYDGYKKDDITVQHFWEVSF